MSKRDRDRKDERRRRAGRKAGHVPQAYRAAWGCKNPRGCAVLFSKAKVYAGLRASAAAERAARSTPAGPMTVVCPACNFFHHLAADGKALRPLTPAELFSLHVDIPNAAARAETYRPGPGGGVEVELAFVEK